jgi:F0F1-type ATP synthase membrane subunit c/vacuolar-type H+-ATPase subunit K
VAEGVAWKGNGHLLHGHAVAHLRAGIKVGMAAAAAAAAAAVAEVSGVGGITRQHCEY